MTDGSVGEGQHGLVPKRPDPIGANATLQYAVLSSTALAAVYTSFASRYTQRVAPRQSISKTALFIRSSAKLGLWAGVVGATVNWYYYSSFAEVVLSQEVSKVKRWKLYEQTRESTVEDACLAGAVLGLAASIPTLFMRRLAIPRWTRCLGMANIGASAGLLGAHGYFQYTGERQKAYKRLDGRLKRRSLEFWTIFWDNELMARLDPIWQHYVRHNGIWYSQPLPDDASEQPEDHSTKTQRSKADAEAPVAYEEVEELPFYTKQFDYAKNLEQIDVDATIAEREKLEVEKAALLAEAEYLLFVKASKEHSYCHSQDIDEDERLRRLQEIHLVELTYNRLRSEAHAIEVKLIKWRMALQHKSIWKASDPAKSSLLDWLPKADLIDLDTHRPTIALQDMERFQSQIAAEVRRFEELSVDLRYTPKQRERWRKDLEDGRVLLKAADKLAFELRKVLDAQEGAQGVTRRGQSDAPRPLVNRDVSGLLESVGKAEDSTAAEERKSKAQADKDKIARSRAGALESEKP